MLALAGAVFGQSFPEKWPSINAYMQGSVTSLVSGGLVVGEPGGGYLQRSGNVYTVYFPAGGIFTQVNTYIPPVHYLNVSGGLLTMSGNPTGYVNVIELIPATLTAAGFVKGDGTPESSWLVAKGSNPMRLSRIANGFAIRNYADDEYRDLVCRNLTVGGSSIVANVDIVNVETNRITLNANWVGAPALDAYYTVCRGTSPTAMIQWVEGPNRWKFGVEGAMQYIDDIATNAVVGAWPGVTNLDLTAQLAVSNRWPWIMAITAAQIHNWDTVHVWSETQTYAAVTGYWPWIYAWTNSAGYLLTSADTTRWNNGYSYGVYGSNTALAVSNLWAGNTNAFVRTNDSRLLTFSGRVQGADPSASNDLVNLNYFTRHQNSPVTYYLDIGSNGTHGVAGARNASVVPALTNGSVTYASVTQDQYLATFTFAEQAEYMGPGLYRLNLYAQRSGGTKNVRLTWEGYQFTNGAVYQDFETGALSELLVAGITDNEISFVNTGNIARVTNGVFGLKIRVAEVSGSGTAPTVTLWSGPDYLSHLHTPDAEGVWVNHIEFNAATSALTVAINSVSNAAGTVTNLLYNGTNTPNYAVSFAGYPKLTLSTNWVTISSGAGTPLSIDSMTNAFDADLTTCTTTGSVEQSPQSIVVQLATNYSGVATVKLTVKDTSPSDSVTWDLGYGSDVQFTSGRMDGGFGDVTLGGGGETTDATFRKSFCVVPFSGSNVVFMIKGTGSSGAGNYCIYDFSIYGVTNAWNGFSGSF